MARPLRQYYELFNRRQLRERVLIAITLLVTVGFGWWIYAAEPQGLRLASLDQANAQLAAENADNREIIAAIRQRMADGVHREKQAELTRLDQRLGEMERELRVKTIELIPPQKMFALMNQLILRNSKLTLQRLARREVRSAIPVSDPAAEEQESGIYRHVMEIELSGRYLDILDYLQKLEALDWKLLWDEIEISNDRYPRVDLRLQMSTLSTERQWVGI